MHPVVVHAVQEGSTAAFTELPWFLFAQPVPRHHFDNKESRGRRTMHCRRRFCAGAGPE